MRIIKKSTLEAFWLRHPDSKESLLAWYREVEAASWENPIQLKEKYRSASVLKNKRVVFNLKGNKYRLVVRINYSYGVVYIRFIGTHSEYDEVDVNTV